MYFKEHQLYNTLFPCQETALYSHADDLHALALVSFE